MDAFIVCSCLRSTISWDILLGVNKANGSIMGCSFMVIKKCSINDIDKLAEFNKQLIDDEKMIIQ